MSIFCSNKSDSSSRLARSFKNSAWSMSSLMTALPESPSTICSHASTILPPNTRHSLHSNTTHHATEFSTPRDHVRTITTPSRNSFFASSSNESFYHNNHFLLYFVITHLSFLAAFHLILSSYFFSGFLKMFPIFHVSLIQIFLIHHHACC